jgi:hypothetical protein
MHKNFTLKALTLMAWIQICATGIVKSQGCSPLGDQTTYGTNNTWIGYVYKNSNLTGYIGYVNEGTAASPNFDENFGGDNVTYSTNGCSTTTEKFSVRYKLTKAISGTYDITVGGDDGYRLSLDGGATWVINKWFDQSYATTTVTLTLSGNSNLVLEFYENTGSNRVSFNMTPGCLAAPVTETYGTNNIWNGYIYSGTSFNNYKGLVNRGITTNANFDESFGGSTVNFPTSSCPVYTELFSARFRLRKSFALATYTITVGGDDGYRLSFDGGATWAINKWADQSYGVTTWTGSLGGTYNIVLEYYENSGFNRLSIDFGANGNASTLPVSLTQFTAREETSVVKLNWATSSEQNTDHFDVQRSADGRNFSTLGQVHSAAMNGFSSTPLYYAYTDNAPLTGSTSYYRLRVVDKDGSITYSNVIRMNGQGQTGLLRIYPTLVDQQKLYLAPSTTMKDVTVDVYSMNGARMQQQQFNQISGGQTVTMTLKSGLPKGMYLVSVRDASQVVTTQKIIIP